MGCGSARASETARSQRNAHERAPTPRVAPALGAALATRIASARTAEVRSAKWRKEHPLSEFVTATLRSGCSPGAAVLLLQRRVLFLVAR